MRYASDGIGIDKVSLGVTTLNVYGNEKFAKWCEGGVLLSKIVKPGDDQFTIVLTKGVKRVPNQADASNKWSIALNQAANLLPKFGQTDPVGVTFVGKELHIVIPPKSKRAQLLRGKHQGIGKSSPANLTVTPPNTPPQNTITRVMNDVRNGVNLPPELRPAAIAPSTDPLMRAQQLIAELNALREQLGKDVLRSYSTADGSFKATVMFT